MVWAPGNHELWTHPNDPVTLRGVARYDALVAMCRELGVLTPEDEYAVWRGDGGPVTVAPLFLLYDYSFRAPGTTTKEESLRAAYDAGVVCTDEMLLHPDPYPDRESWCAARLEATRRRLEATDPALPTVLVSHWPLVRQPTEVLWFPEFAQWCGTDRTADWHVRHRAAVAVYGHLHIPRTTHYDGVRFEEVSLGYPREWRRSRRRAGAVADLPEADPRDDRGAPAGRGAGRGRGASPTCRTSAYPGEEEPLVARAVGRAAAEFVTARRLRAGGAGPRSARPRRRCRPAARGEPVWPDGVVGSITHCAGYRAARGGPGRGAGRARHRRGAARAAARRAWRAWSPRRERGAAGRAARRRPGDALGPAAPARRWTSWTAAGWSPAGCCSPPWPCRAGPDQRFRDCSGLPALSWGTAEGAWTFQL